MLTNSVSIHEVILNQPISAICCKNSSRQLREKYNSVVRVLTVVTMSVHLLGPGLTTDVSLLGLGSLIVNKDFKVTKQIQHTAKRHNVK